MNKQARAGSLFERALALSARVIMLREQLTRVQAELPEAESALAALLAGRDEMPERIQVAPTDQHLRSAIHGAKTVQVESVTPGRIQAGSIPSERPSKPLPASAAERQAVAGPGVAPVRELALAELRHGPLTTAELCHRLTEKHGLPRQSGYDQLNQLSKKGLVVKREESSTNLDKWFLVESPRNGASA